MSMDVVTYPPGPKGLPVVGNAYHFSRDPLGFVQAVQRNYGDVATIHFGRQPVLLCSLPEHVRFFLIEKGDAFTPVGTAPNLIDLLGDGLLTTDGAFHDQERRRIQPAFHRRRVESYATTMVRFTEEWLDRWHPGAEVDIAWEMSRLTLRVVAQSLFSIDLERGGAADELSQSFKGVIEEGPQPILPIRIPQVDLPFTRHGRYMAARRRLDAFIYGLIAHRRAEGGELDDVLDWLIAPRADGTTLTDRQIRDQTLTLLAAGHVTTANALTWTVYLLGEYPEVRAKLMTELETELGGRAPTAADLPRLPYLEWVVTEAMRLYPPAWIQGRIAREPFALAGQEYPAGTRVLFSQWVIHRRPDIWGDPEAFRPERWDATTENPVPRWAYFPFGGGSRVCIGMTFAQMEARLLLATILQRYTPRLAPGVRVDAFPRITLRSMREMRMILGSRHARV